MTSASAAASGETSPWAAPAAPENEAPLSPLYAGSRWRLFWLAFSRMALTIATLGLGRFWMLTRLRRHYWSSISIDGAPLEYTGRAGEKLVGFLIAVVVLAVYLLIVNLSLFFIGLSWFQGNPLALQLPLVAGAPMIFWARYKAWRYVLARTRWRGIRFGLEPGAWGYMARALLWWAVTILTLGLLYPLLQMKLSRFVTNRSFYGDLRFEQTGSWLKLLKSWLFFWAPAVIGLALFILGFERPGADGSPDSAALLGALGLLLLAGFAFLRHRVFSFRYLNSNKQLNGGARAAITLGLWPVIGVYLGGGLIIAFVFLLYGGVISVIGAAALSMDELNMIIEDPAPGLPGLAVLLGGAAAYLPGVALFAALSHAFIRHPLIRATVARMTIHDIAAARGARQRPHDAQAEAGGFADALGADAGGAF